MNRKWIPWAVTAIAFGVVGTMLFRPQAAPAETVVTVYKSPTCGCCAKWAEHLEANGFEVIIQDVANLSAVKAEHGVPGDLQSCHTATVGGYVIEGHVPADVIRRFLAERPAGTTGLAVPGMPAGSPGMEGPPPVPYNVMAFDAAGRATVYDRR